MFFELLHGAIDEGAATGALPACCAGAWRITAGAPLPGRVLLLRWQALAERDAALAAGTHPTQTLAWGRHEAAIYGASAAWNAARTGTADAVHPLVELRVQRLLNGHTAEAARTFGESTLPLLQAMGAQVLGVFELLLGAHRPRMATFLAWPDLAAQQHAWARLDVEPRFWRRRDEERARLHRRLFGDEQTLLLSALPGTQVQPNFGVDA